MITFFTHRAFRLSIMFFLLFISCAFIVNINHSNVRFSDGNVKKIYKVLKTHKNVADLAFFGTSRTKRAIIGDEISELLRNFKGHPVTVYDLSVSGRSYDVGLVIFKEFGSEQKLPKTIGIQLSTKGQKKAHAIYPFVASWEDIFFGPAEGANFVEIMSWRTKQIRRKLIGGVLNTDKLKKYISKI